MTDDANSPHHSGLKQLMQQGTPYSRKLGIRYVEARDREGITELDFASDLSNINGNLHGGASYSLIDTAMGLAVYGTLSRQERVATLEIKTNYLKPVREGLVRCHAKVIHRGRATIVLEADVTQGERVVAKAIGTFAVWQQGATGQQGVLGRQSDRESIGE